jgi:hypothetical protein
MMKKHMVLSHKARRAVDSIAIELVLEAANGKATAHAVTGTHELAALAERAEKHLQANGVRKDLRPGSKVHYRPAGPNAGAYKYTAITTFVTLERNTAGWLLAVAERDAVYPKQAEYFLVTITDAAMQCAVEKTLAAFGRTSEGWDKSCKASADKAIEDAAIAAIAGSRTLATEGAQDERS